MTGPSDNPQFPELLATDRRAAVLSAAEPSVVRMESEGIVDPGDAAIQALMALTAENTRDEQKRDMLMDFMLTAPPLAEWPREWREMLLESCQFIKNLAEDLRRRGETRGGPEG